MNTPSTSTQSQPDRKRLRQLRIDQMFGGGDRRTKSKGAPLIRNTQSRLQQRYSPVVSPANAVNGGALHNQRQKPTAEPLVRASSAGCSTWNETNEMISNVKPTVFSRKRSSSEMAESTYNNDQNLSKSTNQQLNGQETYRGTSLTDLVDGLKTADLGTLQAGPTHFVLVATATQRVNGSYVPYPNEYTDVWDSAHVRMPCSGHSLCPSTTDTDQLLPRWTLIQSALQQSRSWTTAMHVQEAIMTYNARHESRWDFSKSWHKYVNSHINNAQRKVLFECTLPAMADLVLDMPNIVTQPVPFVRQGYNHRVTMSQRQVACLLAAAFFCTFPNRNWTKKSSEMNNFPRINFTSLFSACSKSALAKLDCIFNYFRRVTDTPPDGLITYERRVSETDLIRALRTSNQPISKLHVTANGTIEDSGPACAHMDFANKYIGGGVLGHGCVQEEIRFAICPELIVAQLFTEVMADNECVVITGAERFSSYSGYADTFKYTGDYVDCTVRDVWHRRSTQVLAVDATSFGGYKRKLQFTKSMIDRDMRKVLLALSDVNGPGAVATGNWGCGAFGGDKHLKAVIQLMAASECGKHVAYYTFGDTQLMHDLAELHSFLIQHKVTVGVLYRCVLQVAQSAPKGQLLQSIIDVLSIQGPNDCDPDPDTVPDTP